MGIIQGKYKVVVGTLSNSGWPSSKYPGGACDGCSSTEKCGKTVDSGCMFDIFADPGEHKNIAKRNPAVFKVDCKNCGVTEGRLQPRSGQLERQGLCSSDQEVWWLLGSIHGR